MNFNERLKELRVKKGMTQEELAEKLHITRQSVSKWEQGINEPNIETIKKIATIFEITIDDLVESQIDYDKEKINKQTKIEKSGYLLNIALSLIIILISLVTIRILQNTIPIHFNSYGDITRHGSKYEILIFTAVSIIFLLISLLTHYKMFGKVKELNISYIISQFVLAFLQIGVLAFILFYTFKYREAHIDETIIITGISFSILMIVSIFVSPLVVKKPSGHSGFRTSFTLTNPVAWKKINKLQSILGFIASLIAYLIIIIWLPKWSIFLFILIIATLIPTTIYHEVLRYKAKKSE